MLLDDEYGAIIPFLVLYSLLYLIQKFILIMTVFYLHLPSYL